MKTREIRIGNILIDVMNREVTVHGIKAGCEEIEVDYVNGGGIYPMYNKYLRPIPLSSEWLLRAGFELKKVPEPEGTEAEFYRIDNFELKKWEDGYLFYPLKELGLTQVIQSVHTLQNLYFTLTGSELEFKQPASNQVQTSTLKKIITIVEEKGVAAKYKDDYWGIQLQNENSILWGYGSIDKAYLADSKICKTPKNFTYPHSIYVKELAKAHLVKIVKTTTYEEE